MCGIAGLVGGNPQERQLLTMLTAQKHRGPDFLGTYFDDGIALGHNRLSIIDLSPEANQPFYSKDGRYILVYNGEIYNYLELKESLKAYYPFKTKSDSEVLLAAYIHWGSSCLEHFNGMFSFAIWDTQEKQLFAARDRFGVKPFFYSFNDTVFSFASEIKTLFASGIKKSPNEQVWANYFVYGSYGMPNESFWNGITQLPGGHYLILRNSTLVIKKWYHFEEEVKKYSEKLPFEEVISTYESILKESIALRFRADVPVGFNISGGLDSSTLLAFVNEYQQKSKIKAFTFYTNDERYDELPWVEEMIATTGNPLYKVLLKTSEVVALGQQFSDFQDEPYGGLPTIAYAKLFKEAKKLEVKVLLDGQGMDEQWAGYDYYTKKNENVIQGILGSPLRPHVLNDVFFNQAKKPIYPKPFDDEVKNLQFRDLFYTKIPRALRFNDRISMAASTELREPFLDYRLVEFAFAQPLKYKIKGGIQKYLLRELVSKYLSNSIRYAPKRPLQTPQREWLGKELRDWVETEISYLKAHNWFKKEELQKELNLYFKGNQESSFHIWQWINTSLLLK
ncbi:asparagine synthase (glutamine-hydrolyzing) [Aureisphaera sp. CAU 1614]|uniref:asparagine synthase (glutamine-hydrolyzing) n=1 Tax=Halomarinibacterium sedimenti TaxID=2857106 RepID=A0A9X1FN44_9FLAO|nr:asparagine synthase (glutamine-hydrolyzing) [Halomarinibacterium sedimenti]MBW2937708.1 asparagine synthase (glutamine-hydrolyzing) [Halomarinibacterium sedimenti]